MDHNTSKLDDTKKSDNGPDESGGDTIIECEYYQGLFYLFDILKLNGKKVIDQPLHKRLELL